MNKQLLLGVGIGVVVAAAAGAVASFSGKKEAVQPLAVTAPAPAEAVTKYEPATQAAPVEAAPAEPKVADAAVAQPAVAAETAAPAVKKSTAPVHVASAAPATEYAVVLSSTAVTDTQKVPREECRDVQVTHQKPVKDEKRVAGAALGALVGGVLGNQIGGGDGKKLATAAGAVAGGVAGSKIQRRMQESNTETVTERKCSTVYDIKEKTLGYDVKYKLAGEVRTVRMAAEPVIGSKLPVRNGQIVAATR